MRRYNENGGGWIWILGGLGAAAALWFWSHKASAPTSAPQITPAQYKAVRDQMLVNVTIDESAAPGHPGATHNGGKMLALDVDNLTQVYFRADPTEMNTLFIKVLNPEGYAQTVNYMAPRLSGGGIVPLA
jgi:hypothetical protein